jgi:hypothetical protein
LLNRRWVFALVFILLILSISAGTWYYRSQCRGIDACAAVDAESHERDKPSEAQ